MRFFDWLFRRKKAEPVELPARPQPGPDIIGRQAGQKRNRVHIFRQPFGYPIRACDWVAVERESVEYRGEAQGVGGPAELKTLAVALDYRECKGDRICCHCRAVALGKRSSVGMYNHGHGKGAK